MVHEANIKAAASEKALKEARMQVIIKIPISKSLFNFVNYGYTIVIVINQATNVLLVY